MSAPEREALRRLEEWGLVDVFRQHYGDAAAVLVVGLPRAGTSTRAGACASTSCWPPEALAARVGWAVIDRNARKGKQPSDHAPVVVDFAA